MVLMCRIFAYCGSSVAELERLRKALSEAAEYDMIAEKLGLGFSSHADGWGYVIASEDGKLLHYRNSAPIFKDGHRIPQVDGKFFALFHARKASEKGLVGPIFSHPLVDSSGSETLFLLHNGRVDKEAIGNELGIDTNYLVDSEAALKFISKKGVEKGSEALEKYTVSGLNLMLLSFGRVTGEINMYCKNYYIRRDKSEYYDLYIADMDEGKAVFSSTLSNYGMVGRKVAYGKLFKFAQGRLSMSLQHAPPGLEKTDT